MQKWWIKTAMGKDEDGCGNETCLYTRITLFWGHFSDESVNGYSVLGLWFAGG